jgi:prepilin-type N-terminal cleavage/methylation domain-containing protein
MNDSEKSTQEGFSLIETLVALVLLVIGVAAVTTGFVEGHRLAEETGTRQRAISLAQDKLAQTLARTYDAITIPDQATERVEGGMLIGEDEVNGIARTWVVEPDYPAPGLSRVWIATRWIRRGAVQTVQVAGLLAEGLPP